MNIKEKIWNAWAIVLVGLIIVLNIISEMLRRANTNIVDMGDNSALLESLPVDNLRFDVIEMVCLIIAIIGLMYAFRKIINPELIASKGNHNKYVKILGKYTLVLYLPCIVLMMLMAPYHHLLLVKLYINWLSPVLIAGITVSCLYELKTEKDIQNKILGAYLSLVLILVTIGNVIIPFVSSKIQYIGLSKVGVSTFKGFDEMLSAIYMCDMIDAGIAMLWQIVVIIVSIYVLSRLVPVKRTENSSLFNAN